MIEATVVAMLISTLAPTLGAEQRDRYAADIAVAAADDTELMLGLVAVHFEESRFEERIERCHCRSYECDNGEAFAAPQLHRHWLNGYAPAEVCASNTLAQSLAARALVTLRRRTGTIRRALVAYIGCKRSDVRAKKRLAVFERLLASSKRVAT
jgi:hypothetical protein